MANLNVLGDFEGPGEERTAFYLKNHLPESWHVISGRKLDDRNRTDIDFIVVGENRIFVVEEKHWGPMVALGEVRWSVVKKDFSFSERSNPLNQVSQNAKKVAGWLKNLNSVNLNHNARPIEALVIMSYENVELKSDPTSKQSQSVLELEGCEKYFLELDKNDSASGNFQEVRKAIIAAILGLKKSERDLSRIGEYSIKSEIADQSAGVRTFWSEVITTGQEVVLTCFDDSYWNSQDGSRNEFILRETAALHKLGSLGCAWFAFPPFLFEEKQWWVVPTLKPSGFVSLESYIQDAKRRTFKQFSSTVLLNSLLGLKEIHEAGVIHKDIQPSYLWLGPKFAVRYSNFRFAHLDGHATIRFTSSSSDSNDFRAPEVSDVDYTSTVRSDVYSLGVSLCKWLFESKSVPEQVDPEVQLVADVLKKMTEHDPKARISVGEAISLFDAPIQSAENAPLLNPAGEFVEGGKVAGRFQLLQQVGKGGMGTSWLATDDFTDGRLRVLKALKSEENYVFASGEFTATRALEGLAHCSTAREIQSSPSPGFLMYDYYQGQTLEALTVDKRFDLDLARDLLLKALHVLSTIHARGIIHGDISPTNLLVNENDEIVFIDFGLAGLEGHKQNGGTPSTMSPEAAAGEPTDRRSDIYSLCATFVSILLGRSPYAGSPNQVAGRDWSIEPLSDIEKIQWGDKGVFFLGTLLEACTEQASNRPDNCEVLIERILSIPQIPVEDWPAHDASKLINPDVDNIRKLYVRSRDGSSDSLGKDSPFAIRTYVNTSLDNNLIPDFIERKLRLVLVTGNAGDGKTALLQTLQEKIKELGGVTAMSNSSGWTMSYGDHTYTAVFDASESSAILDKDQLVEQALGRYTEKSESVVIAINDGRMREFFETHSTQFLEIWQVVEDFFNGEAESSGDIAIVDLKQRSLVAGGPDSIFNSVVDTLTSSTMWSTCSGCSVKNLCPIFENAKLIEGKGRRAVEELVSIAHVKRKSRATIRQLRSTVAWLITGDLTCTDVHEAVENQKDLTRGSFAMPELAFSQNTSDPLVKSWRSHDPASLISSRMSKFLGSVDSFEPGLKNSYLYTKAMRRAYFGLGIDGNDGQNVVDSSETKAYKHLDEYLGALIDPKKLDMGILLRGLSRFIGFNNYVGNDLVVARRISGEWAPLRVFPNSQFSIQNNLKTTKYVETQPDSLTLIHEPSGNHLTFDLDMFEAVMRSSNGSALLDQSASSIRHEVEFFTNVLVGEPTQFIRLVHPSGASTEVSVVDGIIMADPLERGSND